jgi:hypothetical protein
VGPRFRGGDKGGDSHSLSRESRHARHSRESVNLPRWAPAPSASSGQALRGGDEGGDSHSLGRAGPDPCLLGFAVFPGDSAILVGADPSPVPVG